MLFKDYSLNQFMDELISDAPSPGGGSTAALVAALASGLNSMVYSLTVDKKTFELLSEKEKEEMKKFQREAKKFNKIAQEFMEKDREDFVELMASYRLPKETNLEKEIRKESIRKNSIKAMETPLNLGKEAIEFYENIEFAIKFGNKNLISDAGVAAILLHSSIESAVINVKVNLNQLRNEKFTSNIERECSNLLKNSNDRKNRLLEDVEKIIYPQ